MNTKWNLFLIMIICASMFLAACSGVGSATPAAGTSGREQGETAMQLALGMFKLESSAYPVGTEEAATLLPLWKAARALGRSDSTADEEVTALISQIQSSLTAEQLQAIQGMTAEEMSQIAQEQGITVGSAAAPSANAAPADAAAGGAAAGGMGAGGMMGGDPGMMGGAPGTGGGSSTQAAGGTSEAGSFDGVSTTVLNTIIELLQAKVS